MVEVIGHIIVKIRCVTVETIPTGGRGWIFKTKSKKVSETRITVVDSDERERRVTSSESVSSKLSTFTKAEEKAKPCEKNT